jgi:hypothetical protein
MGTKTRDITVTGYVVPDEYEGDDIVSVLIEGDDDEDYYLEYTGPEIELADFVDLRVEVSGPMSVRNGRNYITTTKLVETKDFEDDEELTDDLFDDE